MFRVDNPKGKHPVTEFWTFEEFKKVMRTFDCSEYEDRHRYTTIWLYYMTGVRVSEGLALKWKDIDFDKKLLNVHATLEKDENGNWYAKQQTKTVAGLRKIDLDDVTLEVLTNWREVQVQMAKMIMFYLDLVTPYVNQLSVALLSDRLRL